MIIRILFINISFDNVLLPLKIPFLWVCYVLVTFLKISYCNVIVRFLVYVFVHFLNFIHFLDIISKQNDLLSIKKTETLSLEKLLSSIFKLLIQKFVFLSLSHPEHFHYLRDLRFWAKLRLWEYNNYTTSLKSWKQAVWTRLQNNSSSRNPVYQMPFVTWSAKWGLRFSFVILRESL